MALAGLVALVALPPRPRRPPDRPPARGRGPILRMGLCPPAYPKVRHEAAGHRAPHRHRADPPADNNPWPPPNNPLADNNPWHQDHCLGRRPPNNPPAGSNPWPPPNNPLADNNPRPPPNNPPADNNPRHQDHYLGRRPPRYLGHIRSRDRRSRRRAPCRGGAALRDRRTLEHPGHHSRRDCHPDRSRDRMALRAPTLPKGLLRAFLLGRCPKVHHEAAGHRALHRPPADNNPWPPPNNPPADNSPSKAASCSRVLRHTKPSMPNRCSPRMPVRPHRT